MQEIDSHTRQTIRNEVWAAALDLDELAQWCEDLAEEGHPEEDRYYDSDDLYALARRLWNEKKEAEKGWPSRTDFHRLDEAFQELDDTGIICLHNAGTTQSDGLDDCWEIKSESPDRSYRGYCFYHGQDVDRVLQEKELYLAFGAYSDGAEDSLVVAKEIVLKLSQKEFVVAWDGSPKTRINLTMDYKRPSPA